MFALVLPFVAEIFKWILGALLSQGMKPTTADIIAPTPPDVAERDKQLAAVRSFPGIPKILLIFLGCILTSGCWGSRVIVLRPAVPMILAEDIHNATVFVKQDDGTYVEGTANLFAGETVLANPDDFPLSKVLKDQQFRVVNSPATK